MFFCSMSPSWLFACSADKTSEPAEIDRYLAEGFLVLIYRSIFLLPKQSFPHQIGQNCGC